MRPNIQCDAPTCWCNADYRERWIPSMDVNYDVQALPYVSDPWLFRYVYIERNQHEQA